jgi:DNA protecting protein DprA
LAIENKTLVDKPEQTALRDETVAFLALAAIHGIGYWTLRKLAETCDTYERFHSHATSPKNSAKLKSPGGQLIQTVDTTTRAARESLWEAAVTQYRDLREQGIAVIHAKHDAFPTRLRDIDDRPHWLFVQGDASLLQRPAITLVGTRTPTEDGKFLATYIGALLPRFGAVAVSGLAVGIDQIIHRAAIRYAVPTIAFLGHGLLARYQTGSDELRSQILHSGGAIVSEYLPSQSFSSENFVRRNRLQAGVASLVVPVEWREKSGTAHTVRYAIQQKKALMCVRLPDWNGRGELRFAAEAGAAVFTIPGDEERIVEFVTGVLRGEAPPDVQLSLPI